MVRLIFHITIVFVLCTFYSCSTTKDVPDGDKLYTGAKVKIEGNVSAKEKKVLRTDLDALTRPKPNSRFLGIPFKLMMNSVPFLKKSMGEPPVLLSELDLENNVKVLISHLENRGYFHAKVTGDTIVKAKKAHAVYEATPGVQYKIASVEFETDSSVLTQSIRKAMEKTLLEPSDPYILEVIKAERTRIDAHLKENGFYYFDPDFIIAQVDSTVGNNSVNIKLRVKSGTPDIARNVYTINDVYIYADYSITTAANDTNKANAVFHKGFYVIDPEKLYRPLLFENQMQFRPGEIYNRTDHNQTISRLINLNMFKFVKNRFEDVPWSDSSKLNAYYYLTPLPTKSLTAEVNTLTKSNSANGSQVSFTWRHRNMFRAGEQVRLEGYIGTEIQFNPGDRQGYNTYRAGAEINFTFPRFVTPLFEFNPKGSFVPRTNIQGGFDILNKSRLYTLNSFRIGYGYIWKKSIRQEREFYPVSITYVQPFKISQAYMDSVAKDSTLLKPIEKQFILGSYFTINYNELVGHIPQNAVYSNFVLDLSGNIAGLITGGNAKEGKPVKILNAEFAQYVKAEEDFRFYRKINDGAVWANRIIVGLGIPYGNSLELPFVKQFFVGGNNSLRGFRSRSVGPGRYKPPPSTRYLPDQTGDIKLEMNTEFRSRLYSMLHGAVFVDAGNVWLWNEKRLKPGGKFGKDFLAELAVDAGVGLRIDLTIFVIRFDVAVPLRKPWLPKGDQWVIGNMGLNTPEGKRENIVYNLAIGYPF